mmetsp:Transcript_8254/g.24408  ORF Transcript_8254/g.24408 Transcript_8254/m.24408 type:complete len:531 (+) Transcript_8254:503-2095(+)
MGNSASGEEDYEYYEESDYAKQFDGIETLGYRVLGVQPNSPASKAGLVSFFDFIVGANQLMLLGSGVGLKEGDEYEDVDFPRLLRENLHKPVQLLVWNIKARDKRVVTLLPSDDWGGAGLLGVTIKLDDYGGADERLVRVLDTVEKGPAHQAGLIAREDYLLGTTVATLSDTDVLASLLQSNLGRVVELYVYNSVTDVVRVVGLHPTYRWGDGSSLLGASVGTGYLHRLPEACRTTIGSSVERKVSVGIGLRPCGNGSGNGSGSGSVDNDHNGETPAGEHRINIEPTLEMEVDHSDDEDEDVDEDVDEQTRNNRNRNRNRNRPRAVQPHQLGTTEVPSSNGEARAASGTDPAQMPTVAGTAERPDPPPFSQRAPAIVPAAEDGGGDGDGEPSAAAPDGFPEAAPLEEEEAAPLLSASPLPNANVNVPPPPPPPLAESPSRRCPPPPPPPPAPPLAATSTSQPTPPPAQPVASPDPPEDDEHDDDDGSEYTDGSYTDDDGEYTDDEHESPPPKRGGGFFSSFMPAPPKMEY